MSSIQPQKPDMVSPEFLKVLDNCSKNSPDNTLYRTTTNNHQNSIHSAPGVPNNFKGTFQQMVLSSSVLYSIDTSRLPHPTTMYLLLHSDIILYDKSTDGIQQVLPFLLHGFDGWTCRTKYWISRWSFAQCNGKCFSKIKQTKTNINFNSTAQYLDLFSFHPG